AALGRVDRPRRHRARARRAADLRRLHRRGGPSPRPRGPPDGLSGRPAGARVRALPGPARVPAPARRGAVRRPTAATRDRAGARLASRRPALGRALARPRPARRRRHLQGVHRDPRGRHDDPAGRAARPADGRPRQPHAYPRRRRVAADARARRRGGHREDHRRLSRLVTVLASIDLNTLGDAFGLGAIYALMAVGIGLVFGVLRLVNFAYGQLIMAGAYTPAYPTSWPVTASIVACFAVVVALSLAMDRLVFRPLRSSSPAVMLVTTFAVSFLLQAIALIIDLRDGTLGEVATAVAPLNQAITVGGVDVRKVTFVAVGVAAGALIVLALVLTRTTIGLHTRAAASDFRTARLLGVRAHRVIAFAVVVPGVPAPAVRRLLAVQDPFAPADFPLEDTIIGLVGVVVGGIDRLWTATLGGFAIGFVSVLVNAALPTDKTVFLPSVVFALVIIVLLLRPAGLFAWGRRAAMARV